MPVAPKPARPLDDAARQLAREHLSIARRVAISLWHPGSIEFDDLLSAAYIGLCEAARDYDPTKTDAGFEKYAVSTCWNRVLDGMRSADPLSRSARRLWKRTERGEEPTTAKERYLAVAASNARTLSLDACLEFDHGAGLFPSSSDVAGEACDAATIERVRELVGGLPYQLRWVYHRLADGADQETIAVELGVCSSRVSQLRSELIARLARQLGEPVPDRHRRAV